MTIEVAKLEMAFGGVTALSINELTIVDSSATVLTGHNGAGKSTLLMIVAGLLEATQGSVTIDGAKPGSLKARSIVSFAPDQPALFDDLTLSDQLLYIARLHGLDKPHPRSDDLIEALDAAELLPKFPRAMSKGQRQKASLLVACSRPFEVLLLDEPTTALDSASRTAVVEAVTRFSGERAMVVSSTHDDELIAAADHRVELVNGSVA